MRFKIEARVIFEIITDNPEDLAPTTIVELVEQVRSEVVSGDIPLTDYNTKIEVASLELLPTPPEKEG